jgi:hypothetical protein
MGGFQLGHSNLYAFYGESGGTKYVRVAHDGYCCLACLETYNEKEFKSLKMHAAGVPTLYKA